MLKRLFHSKDGNFAVIAAVAVVPFVAGIAGAVDFLTISNKASEVQNALDAAGLALATMSLEQASDAELAVSGEVHFRANLKRDDKLTASFKLSRPTLATEASAGPTDYFLVASDVTYEGMIASADFLRAHRESLVKVGKGKPACLLALDKTAASSLQVQGSSKVNMKGCVLAANSRAPDAVYRGGNAVLEAECVFSSGGTSGLTSNPNVKLECGEPWERQYPTSNPLAGVIPPAYTGCKNAPGGKLKTLSPATYCDNALSGDIVLEPGTHIFRGTSIKLGGNGSLTGTGVSIFLMEGATISFGANEVVKLSPPESGPYAGITLFQAAGNTSSLTLQGGVGTRITGFVYAPDAHIQFTGNSDTNGTPDCIRLVGNTIEMTGNSDIALDCEKELGGRKMLSANHVSIAR